MKLTPTQAIIAKDRHRFRVINCGRRFGKTTLAVEEMKGRAIYKKSRITYIATTYQQARDIAWTILKDELGDMVLKVNESRLELIVRTINNEESIITLRGWESIETVKGLAFDFVVIDEIAMMKNFWLCWQEYLRPTLTDTRGDVMFISTPKGFNHFYDLYNLEATDKNFKSFHFTSYDNPYIPKDEIDTAKDQMTEDRFAQEYMADFRKAEGLVYKEFSRERHLFESKDREWKEIIAGVDFGYTNPAAVLEIRVDKDDNFYVYSEWYKTKRTTEQIRDAVLSTKAVKVYPDPAEPDRIEQLNTSLTCLEVSKDVEAGIDKVRELFKNNRLFIHKECKNLIWELETYHYPEKKPDKNEYESPVKENDHCMDALRYALYSYRIDESVPFVDDREEVPSEFFGGNAEDDYNNEFLNN